MNRKRIIFLFVVGFLYISMIYFSFDSRVTYPFYTYAALIIPCTIVIMFLFALFVFAIKKDEKPPLSKRMARGGNKNNSVFVARAFKTILGSVAIGFAIIITIIIGAVVFSPEYVEIIMTRYLHILWLILAIISSPWIYKKMS